MTMQIYQHKQPGYVILLSLGIAILICVVLVNVAHNAQPIIWFVIAILVLSAMLFSSLTIEISDGMLRWRFGIGVIQKSVELLQIASVEPIRIHWINGWGIHWTRKGWLYNVSGWEAVHIRLKNGKRFCLGTDEPAKLAEAIKSVVII